MKILVLGASGMAGHTIALYFKEQGHEVYAFSRKQFLFCTWIGGDAFDIEAEHGFARTSRPSSSA